MLRKFASYEVSRTLEVKGTATRQRTATLDKLSDFRDYRTGDGYIYARIIAQSSRVNKNHDGWPSVELAGGQEAWDEIMANRTSASGPIVAQASSKHKKGFSTFVGKPIFVDHNNDNPERTRGVIVDSKLHILDSKTSAADEYWNSADADPEHLPPTEIELLLEIDAKSFPKFAKAVVEGAKDPNKGIDGFSMGCDVEYSKCSHCGKKASSPQEYCSHIRMKGAELRVESGKLAGSHKKSYENCYGIGYFEISGVFDPADETALTQELIDEQPVMSHTADYTPDTSPINDGRAPGFVQTSPNGMNMVQGNPDLMKAMQMSRVYGIPLSEAMKNLNTPVGPQVYGEGNDMMTPPPELPALTREQHQALPSTPIMGSYLGHRQAAIHTADNPMPQVDHINAPENVDTLREEKICPVCGSDMDADKCDVCGYEEPPEQLQNPDLTKHKELGDEVDGLVDKGEMDGLTEDSDLGDKQPGSYLQNRQNPEVTNEPTAVASHTASGDEPSDETILSDQTTPVTSAFRTAQDLIRATQEKTKMADQQTRVSGEPADASGRADKQVSVTGVGGVMEDTNEQASKPDAKTTVPGKGGVYEDSNAEASRPDEKESLPTAGRDTNDSGFNKDKTTDDSGKTRTWDNSNEPGSAVTDKVFPASGEVKSNAHQAGDDRPFPHGDDALGGGSAKKGVKPNGGADVQPERRVDVMDHVTSPDNNSGPTKTWNGTGGNGVTKQKDPVTRGTLEGQPQQGSNANRNRASFTLSALRLAETEVELGLIDPDKKYERIVELQEQPDEVVDAQQAALSKVKTAGFRRNAATEPKGLGRVPQFSRVASAADAEEEAQKTAHVETDERLDSALFG